MKEIVYNNLCTEISLGLEWSICLVSHFTQNVVCLAQLCIWMGKSILVISMYRAVHLFGLVLVVGHTIEITSTC